MISNKPTQIQHLTMKEVLSFREAVLYLDISASNLYKHTSTRSIKFFQILTKANYTFEGQNLDNWMLQNVSECVSKSGDEVIKLLKKNSYGK